MPICAPQPFSFTVFQVLRVYLRCNHFVLFLILQATEGGPLYSQREPVGFKHDSAGVFMPSTSPKPSSKNVFTPAIDPTIAPVLPEQKVE